MLAGVLLKSVLLLLGEQPDTPRDMTSLAAVCRDWWTTLTSQRLKGWPKLLSINCAVHVMKAFMSEKNASYLHSERYKEALSSIWDGNEEDRRREEKEWNRGKGV